jgi:peptidoglycan/xylan/chitin deacetylase (PgdA/CDA1 family)
MILVLTYHKVLRHLDPESGFYSIRGEQLERQLELLSQSGLQPLSPEALVSYGQPSQRTYLLTFDDGTAGHHEVVMPILARYGCHAVFFVPTTRLDRPGYLGSKQVAEMSRAGQTIGLHSHEHRRLDWLGEEDIRVQMEVSRQIIGDLTGKRPLYFAPVGGYINRRVRDIAMESGIQVIRTMEWGYNPQLNLAALQCIPVNRHFTEDEFRKVLEFRNRSAVLYITKEITKKVIAPQTYESLRRRVFGDSAHK